MATIDQYGIDVSVKGINTLDSLDTKLGNVDKNIKAVNETVTSFNRRTITANIQDIAVQAELGTNWLRILGQQGSEVLAAFGPKGAAAGAALALGIAIARPVLSAMGVDIRNLKEMTDDLDKATKQYTESQKQNQTTIAGLSTSYGSLTAEAKQFFETQQSLKKQVANAELHMAIQQLQKDFGFMNNEIDLTTESSMAMGDAMMGAAASNAWLAVKAKLLGMNTDEARALAKQLKDLDANKPEEVADTLNKILAELDWSDAAGSRLKKQFTETIEPILKINEAILEQKRNIQAAALEASKLQADLLGFQNLYTPDINKSKRNFDQITAAQLEGKMKLAEFDRQMEEKNKDGVNRKAEVDAGRLRIEQDVKDKVADIVKGQSEVFIAQTITNDAKKSQLIMEGRIADLQLGQIDTLDYAATLEEKVLKNINDQQLAYSAINEMRRKNTITAAQALQLEGQADENRKKADENAQKANDKIAADNARNIRIQIEGLALQNDERLKALNLEMSSFTLSTNAQNAKKKELDLENTRNKSIMDINNNNRLSDAEKIAAIAKINEESNVTLEILKSEAAYREQIDASFKMGGYDRAKQISEGFSNFKTAGMAVDAVWGQMSSSIDKFVETGKLSFSDFARSVIYDLEKIALKSAVIGVFKSMGLADLFSLPGKATGGPVAGDTAYMVGEQGPELFIPNNAGKIIPNNQLRGGGGTSGGNTIINNISAIDAKSVAQLFAENRMTLFGSVEQARRELPMRTR